MASLIPTIIGDKYRDRRTNDAYESLPGGVDANAEDSSAQQEPANERTPLMT